jgi:hypothetical protein
LVQITSDIELSGAGCTTAITPNQLVQSSSQNEMARAGCLGGLVTNLRFQEEGNHARRSILSAAERESLLALPDTKDD